MLRRSLSIFLSLFIVLSCQTLSVKDILDRYEEIDYEDNPEYVPLRDLIQFLFAPNKEDLARVGGAFSSILRNESEYFALNSNNQILLKRRYGTVLANTGSKITSSYQETEVPGNRRLIATDYYHETPERLRIERGSLGRFSMINDRSHFYLPTIAGELIDQNLSLSELKMIPDIVFLMIRDEGLLKKVAGVSGKAGKTYSTLFSEFVRDNEHYVYGYFLGSGNPPVIRFLFSCGLLSIPDKIIVSYFNNYIFRTEEFQEIFYALNLIDQARLQDQDLTQWMISASPLEIRVFFLAYYLIHRADGEMTERIRGQLAKLSRDEVAQLRRQWELKQAKYPEVFPENYSMQNWEQ